VLTEIDAQLARSGGVGTRRRLLQVATRGQLDHEIRSGQLVAPIPGALCRPWDADLAPLRRRAALTAVGPPAALSHTSALAAWGLTTPPEFEHVTVPARRAPRSRRGVRVHRVERFPNVRRLDGLVVATAAEAVVASWPVLGAHDRRQPVIVAVRNRHVTAAELAATLDRYPRLPRRASLSELIGLLAAGCESELEIWGHVHVFDVPGLRHAERQKVIRAAGRRYRLDIAYVAEKVAVELDGRIHAREEQRDRDLRRDTALATIGWLTVRFTHRRLTREVAACRRETLAILAARR
jgi:very-short-patch-repair endonuclease